jgi:ribosomal-protein-alanine N-acetyltransferase
VLSLPEGYDVRPLRIEDAAALAASYLRNREHLAAWDPARPPSFYTVDGQVAAIRDRLATDNAGLGRSWVLARGDDVVGRVNLNNLVRGVFQSASLGYWVDGAHTGRGLAKAAVEFACSAALDLGLHRVEAGTLRHNVVSQAVLRACGFTQYGTAADYLYIAGAWQDHDLFQRILHRRPPEP